MVKVAFLTMKSTTFAAKHNRETSQEILVEEGRAVGVRTAKGDIRAATVICRFGFWCVWWRLKQQKWWIPLLQLRNMMDLTQKKDGNGDLTIKNKCKSGGFKHRNCYGDSDVTSGWWTQRCHIFFSKMKIQPAEIERLFLTRNDKKWKSTTCMGSYMGVSENSVPLNPMVLLIIIPIKWLFHWEYTQHFQTNPHGLK